LWVQARFASANSNDFIVRGKIDRIDRVDILPTTSDQIQLQIIDYKTGKKPWFKYSQKINDKIAKEQFWKMKVYCEFEQILALNRADRILTSTLSPHQV